MKNVVILLALSMSASTGWAACSVTDRAALAKAGYNKAEIEKTCAEGEAGPAHAPPRDTSEPALWTEANTSGSREDYQTYLNKYPKGKHAAEAKLRLKTLDLQERAEAERQEEAAWINAQTLNTEQSFQDYVSHYPKGRFLVPAQEQLTLLLAKRDEAAWKQADAARNRTTLQAYLDQFPAGRYANVAKERMEQFKNAPPRPKLPCQLNEQVWQVLENSDYYVLAPKIKPVSLKYKQVDEKNGDKSMISIITHNWTPDNSNLYVDTYTICGNAPYSNCIDGNAKPTLIREYFVGGLKLCQMGRESTEGKPLERIDHIDELKGSLYPLQIGAEQLIRYTLRNYAGRMSSHQENCRITGKAAANLLHPQLNGDAWKIECNEKTTYSSGQSINGVISDTILESIGLKLFDVSYYGIFKPGYILKSPSGWERRIEMLEVAFGELRN